MIKQLFFYDIESENSNEFGVFFKFDSSIIFIFFQSLNFSLAKKIVKIFILTILRFVKYILSPIAHVYHELYIFIDSLIYNKNVDSKYSDKKQIASKINTKSQLSTIDNTKEKYLKTAKNLFSVKNKKRGK